MTKPPPFIKIERGFVTHTLKELTGSTYKVWTILRMYANQSTGECYLSQDDMAEIAGLSRKSVYSALKELERRHFLSIKQMPIDTQDSDQPLKRNYYTIYYGKDYPNR